VSPALLEGRARTLVHERLATMSWWVGLLYLPVAVSHLVILSHGRYAMAGLAIVCSVTLLAASRWLKRHPHAHDHNRWFASLLYATVIVHSLLRLSFAHTQPDMLFVGVLTIALGLVSAPMTQHAISILAYIGGWSAILIHTAGLATWSPVAPALLVTVVLSLVIRHLELTRDARFMELQWIDDVRREQLDRRAHHDTLTGMPNRELFTDRLEEAFALAQEQDDAALAVLYLDLDRFKVVNDSLGPQVGDRLLQSMAQRLLRFVRPGDTVARFGGDEFAILLTDLRYSDDALTVAERIHTVLEEPFLLDEYEVQLEASIGIAMFRHDYQSAGEMMRDADIAMYEAKSRATRHLVFDGEMHARALLRLEVEVDLRRALKRDELRVYYQPIISLGDGELVGFEALVRWQHPSKGLLSPADFLGPAEETGLIIPLGEWVLEQSCRDLRTMNDQRRRPEPLHISVNLSAAQFVHSDFERRLADTLRSTGVAAETLWIEITETTVLDQPDKAEERIRRLRAMGAEVCVDDFGIGYSSLGYLQRFPFSVIKLDRSFIAKEDPKNAAIVEALIQLARGLGMEVVAEGLETAEQVALLTNLGAEMGQGYYFAKPMPVEDALGMVKSAHFRVSKSAHLQTMREASSKPPRDSQGDM
jgi:diguanylate cyclase (GGDEF)-like protein